MGSLTELVGRFRGGSPDAFARLFGRFFPGHVARLGRRLGAAYPGAEGPEDLALSAFHRLWEVVAAESPLADGLCDPGEFLRVLGLLTEQGLREAHRYEHRRRRDVRRTRREADLSSADDTPSPLQAAPQPERPGDPDPAFLDLLAHLLGLLSGRQRAIALHKLDGLSSREIADELGCCRRSVERQLAEIRKRWRRHPDLAAALRPPGRPGGGQAP